MKVLVLMSSGEPEVKWNALRFCNVMLNNDEDVSLFLNGPAVELYVGDSERFPLREQAKIFSLGGGELLA